MGGWISTMTASAEHYIENIDYLLDLYSLYRLEINRVKKKNCIQSLIKDEKDETSSPCSHSMELGIVSLRTAPGTPMGK